jgi:hypothetical protein
MSRYSDGFSVLSNIRRLYESRSPIRLCYLFIYQLPEGSIISTAD